MHLTKAFFNKDSIIQCLGTVSDHIERVYRRAAGSKKLWLNDGVLVIMFFNCVIIFSILKIMDQC